MTAEAVRGKTLVMRTTNGTRALLAIQGAAAVYVCGRGEHYRGRDPGPGRVGAGGATC